MNRKLFVSIYNYTINHKFAKALGIFTSKYSQKLFILIYTLGILLVFIYRGDLLLKFILIPLATLVVNSLLRHMLNKPRPFVKESIVPLVPHESSGSFPSNHSASAMIIALSCGVLNVYIAVALVVLAIFTGVSRIMTGLHYPADILFGWVIAIAAAVIGFIL